MGQLYFKTENWISLYRYDTIQSCSSCLHDNHLIKDILGRFCRCVDSCLFINMKYYNSKISPLDEAIYISIMLVFWPILLAPWKSMFILLRTMVMKASNLPEASFSYSYLIVPNWYVYESYRSGFASYNHLVAVSIFPCSTTLGEALHHKNM